MTGPFDEPVPPRRRRDWCAPETGADVARDAADAIRDAADGWARGPQRGGAKR